MGSHRKTGRPSPAWFVTLAVTAIGLISLGGCPGDPDSHDDDPVNRQTGNAGQDTPGTGGADPGEGGTDPGNGTDPGDGDNDPGTADSPLKGTWTGNVPYRASTMLSLFGSQPFHTTEGTQPTTVTFNAAGWPDRVTIILSEAPLATAELPLADLDAVGDKVTVPVSDAAGETVTATVQAVSTTETAYSLKLAVEYSVPKHNAVFRGPHELQAELGQAGALAWQSTTSLTMATNELTVTNAAASSGTLTRQ